MQAEQSSVPLHLHRMWRWADRLLLDQRFFFPIVHVCVWMKVGHSFSFPSILRSVGKKLHKNAHHVMHFVKYVLWNVTCEMSPTTHYLVFKKRLVTFRHVVTCECRFFQHIAVVYHNKSQKTDKKVGVWRVTNVPSFVISIAAAVVCEEFKNTTWRLLNIIKHNK